MFDANACGVPIGRRFFVEVYNEHPDLPQYKQGDVILCYMMTKIDRWSPVVCVLTGDDHFVLAPEDDDGIGEYWFVYAGITTGDGYIHQSIKDKALDQLGGEWDKQ